MHSHLLQVLLVACLVLPCLGTALKEEGTRKGKRTKVEHDADSLKGEEGEAFGNNVLTSSDDKNEGLQMWNPLESERESEKEKRATRKGKRTREELDTDSLKGEEESASGYNVLRLSKDKNEGSGIINPLEFERKSKEKRGQRKGKRTRVEMYSDSQGEEEATSGYNMLTLSKDKNEGSGTDLSPLDAERKRNEKRATRKGKRANI